MSRWSFPFGILLSAAILVLWPGVCAAYIGPGAGFAVLSSFLIIFLTCLVALFALLLWPFRMAVLGFKRRGLKKKHPFRRIVVLGLDGLDPGLSHRFMRQGDMPNLASLKETGCFRPLLTTKPSISPVAWSTFATGLNPGKHRIFDFFTRDPRTYLPVLTSVKMARVKRNLNLKLFQKSWQKSLTIFLRKGTAFWKLLGQNGIFCTVHRVPISFPPEKHFGVTLSAMCTPDLRGTQGALTALREDAAEGRGDLSDGTYLSLEVKQDRFSCAVPGPPSPTGSDPLTLQLSGNIDRDNNLVKLTMGKESHELTPGRYSPWIRLRFKSGLFKTIKGSARFLVTAMNPSLSIYMTPINIDPEHPAMRVSHPSAYSVYLAKMHGTFSTLGLAEDTWALNERIIDEQAFLDQAYDIFEERRRLLNYELSRFAAQQNGLLFFYFSSLDQNSHMFWRTLDHRNPLYSESLKAAHGGTIAKYYLRLDECVGGILENMDRDDPQNTIIMMSDHGFGSFNRQVNLNTWLYEQGFLKLRRKSMLKSAKYFHGVVWRRTAAYNLGINSLYLNLRGREAKGSLDASKAAAVIQAVSQKLLAAKDPATGASLVASVRAISPQEKARHPNAPDLVVGWNNGYRTSWLSIMGMLEPQSVSDNLDPWSGDHCIAPGFVPATFISNRRVMKTRAALTDIGPTILSLFGLPAPPSMSGSGLFKT